MAQSSRIRKFAALGAMAVLAAASAAPAAPQAEDSTAYAAGAGNAAAVNAVLNRWEPVAEQAGAHPVFWREQYAAVLATMPSPALVKFAKLPVGDASTAVQDYAAFAKALKSAQMAAFSRLPGTSEKGQQKALGSAVDNQVFIPIPPCRIVDTRGGGFVSAGTAKTYYAYSLNGTWSWSTQGGVAGLANAACPGTALGAAGGTLGNVAPSAAVATVTVVNASAAGNWLIWGGNGAPPTSSALNWTAGQVLANTTVIPMGTRGGGNNDFAVKYNGPSGTADLIVDVVGYFVESSATALDCAIVDHFGNGVGNFLNGTNLTIGVPACPAGYSRTATQCFVGVGALPNVPLLEVDETGCYWRNASGSTLNQSDYDTEALCCRVPGQ